MEEQEESSDSLNLELSGIEEDEEETSNPTKEEANEKKGSDSEEVLMELSSVEEEDEEEEEILLELSQEDESASAENDFHVAKRNLLISEPDRIVGRETEVRRIERFMLSALQLAQPQASGWGNLDILGGQAGTGGRCLYVSGVPGTGKTSTVLHILQRMLDDRDEEEDDYPEFIHVCINARKLASASRVMSALCRQLTGLKQAPTTATKTLEQFLTSPGDPVVVVIDEIDYLISRSQKELYTLVDWPTHPQSRLIVVGIANTLDLPERLLLPRIASRFGTESVSFAPYSKEQLEALVAARMGRRSVFHPDALSFCAMSVASSFGDARRVLHLAKKAVEVAEREGHEHVEMTDVHKAIGLLGTLPPTVPITNCSLQEQIFLCALIKELRITKNEYVYFSQVCRRHFSICAEHSFKKPSRIELASVCHRLAQQKLLLATHSLAGVLQKIQLAHPEEEVVHALSLKSYAQEVIGR